MIPFRKNILIDGSNFLRGIGQRNRESLQRSLVAPYEEKIQKVLEYICNRRPFVGRILVDHIENGTRGQKVTIEPMLGEVPGVDDEPRAIAVRWRDAGPAGVRVFNGTPDNPATARDERQNRQFLPSTGKGTDVRIIFTAGFHPLGTKGIFGQADDDVLLHELVHAFRMMMGLDNGVPTDNRKFSNSEEWLAILLTNIYMSEKNDYPLRADHVDSSPTPMDQRGPHRFLDVPENIRWMSHFHSQHETMFRRIARDAIAQPIAEPANGLTPFEQLYYWRGHFNPIRVYIDDRTAFRRRLVDNEVRRSTILPLLEGSTAAVESAWGSP